MAAKQEKRPNFLIVIADDLGFSDTSPYGGEIHTPRLQKLAEEGIRMTNFHTAPACSPTRSMLLSGTDHHIAGLGQLAEHMKKNASFFEGKPGYEGYLNFRVAALSEILKDAGYLNILSGKWHLGLKKEHSPPARGFEKVFSFLAGSGNHYNYEPQFNSPRFTFPWKNQLWMDGDEYMDRTTLPDDFYSTTYTTNRMLDFLKTRTPEEKEKPFLAYLAYLAPHWPLQAPKERWEKYKGKYHDGPDKLGERRVQRLIELGLVPADVVPAKPEGWGLERKWEDLSEREQAESIRKMEVYAAMVEMIDDGVGKVVDYLESTGELDNTFILFMSDNGAEGVMLEALPVMGDETTMADIIHEFYDNSLDNIGDKTSFAWYGPRWASAATAPSRGWKAWPTEGGIRCPCIVRYPAFKAQPEAVTHKFTTVMDILPTVLELAGVEHPGETFHGREIVPVRGKSWVPHLSSADLASTSVHDENEHVHGWELVGLRAIRKGPWKAVWMHPPRGKGKWDLFHVENDPGEQFDKAEQEPEKLAELIKLWEVYHAETGILDYPFIFNYARG
ncbi:arylsulfatase [Thozetella sp. PMI_491]|nr:arylsulfatase [Thozetella sp. PMI_491]